MLSYFCYAFEVPTSIKQRNLEGSHSVPQKFPTAHSPSDLIYSLGFLIRIATKVIFRRYICTVCLSRRHFTHLSRYPVGARVYSIRTPVTVDLVPQSYMVLQCKAFYSLRILSSVNTLVSLLRIKGCHNQQGRN